MITAYEFAQLLPAVREREGGGGLLVLGSSNVDESLFGYLTKVPNEPMQLWINATNASLV